MGYPAPDPDVTRRLLQATQGGDQGAFQELFALHRQELKRMVELRLDTRLRSRLDASDVLQETQLEVWQRLQDYLARRPMPFRLWLRKTALERLQKLHRQHLATGRRAVTREIAWPEQSSLLLARQFVASSSTPSQRLNRRETAERVQAALSRLADADREILLLRNVEGLSYQDVSCLLGIEVTTARKRHGRALLRVRQLLMDSGLLESSHD